MTVLRSGVSTMVMASRPTTRFGSSAARLRLDAGASYAFVQFGLPTDLHKGATVVSATLRVQQAEAWSPTTSRLLTARRVAAKWFASTINWNNQPGITGSVHNVTQTTGPNLTAWEFDVTDDVQAFADGAAKNYGWRIITTASGAFPIRGFRSSTGRPTLEVVYNYAPVAPTSLHPSAGAVSISKPVLQFDSGDIAAVQVQVDPAANATSPAFDSGVVATTQPQLDLATTSYAGLATGASTQWRARVTDDAGRVSPWSQWVTFSRVAKPVVTITQPVGTVWESTPPIMWTSTGQVAYRVTVARASTPAVHLYDTGKVAGADNALTPSKPVFTKDGESYVVTVRTWDAVDREATSGDPTYAADQETTTLDSDPAVTGNTWLDATQKSLAPWVDLTWSRPVMPDGWAVYRDGEVIYVADTAADVLVSGNVYNVVDWTAAPNREHVYRVAPIVNGKTAKGGVTVTMTPVPTGVWVGDPSTGDDVMILGSDEVSVAYGEDADTYTPIGATAPISVVTALRGMEGTVTGLVADAFDRLAADEVDTLYDFKGQPAQEFRLVFADVNIPVVLRNVTPAPRRVGTSPYALNRTVSFDFIQTGELPFDADL